MREGERVQFVVADVVTWSNCHVIHFEIDRAKASADVPLHDVLAVPKDKSCSYRSVVQVIHRLRAAHRIVINQSRRFARRYP